MQPPQKHSRINLADMKDQLTRKIGPERSKQYFDYLKRFLSLKLSKIEFDKLCFRTIGRDNISLHNQLIQSLLKNACTRKPPPKVYHENGSVTAPLGIPCGPRKVPSLASNRKCVTVFDTGGLIETTRLKERMDQISATQGVNQGVSMDCARIVNNGLDAYLKRLMGCFGNFRPVVNGVRPGQRGLGLGTSEEREEKKRKICLLDFRVAMELNPRQLGEDWPFLLEKICNCTHAFQE